MSEERPVCRRCKKKRPIDEPLETARYRTCKPCREIERKKKRLKKLELTGREPKTYVDQSIMLNLATHVSRSNQLQVQATQFELTPPVLAPLNYQNTDVQQRLLQHQQQQQQQAQAAAQQAINNQKIDDRDIPIDELLLKQDTHDSAIDETTSANLFEDADDLNICLHCGSTENIQDNGHYQVCSNCLTNPANSDIIIDDFNQVLSKVSDLLNVIFIKRFNENEGITEFKQFEDGTNNLDEVINELHSKFLNKIIEASNLKFEKISNNFNSKSPLKLIKLLFKSEMNSSIFISYDIFSKDLALKFYNDKK